MTTFAKFENALWKALLVTKAQTETRDVQRESGRTWLRGSDCA